MFTDICSFFVSVNALLDQIIMMAGSMLAVGAASYVSRLLGATDTCEGYAIEYATYVLMVAPFMAATFVMNQCLRAEGSPMRSMLGMGFGGILNCVLDPIFIFHMGLGVTGASMATAISKMVSFSILIYPYMRRRSVLRLSLLLCAGQNQCRP